MKKRKSFLTLLLTLIVALVLSACGGGAEKPRTLIKIMRRKQKQVYFRRLKIAA